MMNGLFTNSPCILRIVLVNSVSGTDHGILGGPYKPNQLFDRPIQLTNDILNGQHRSQCKLAMNHSHSRNKGNANIFTFINEKCSTLLVLLQGKVFDSVPEQLRLPPLPLLTLGCFTIVQFDLLPVYYSDTDIFSRIRKCGLCVRIDSICGNTFVGPRDKFAKTISSKPFPVQSATSIVIHLPYEAACG